MLYAKHESGRCGSDWTCICKDLKTYRGVKNRVKRGAWPKGEWRIYQCSESEWYKTAGHVLLGKFYKA
jgi:hypothetical protein